MLLAVDIGNSHTVLGLLDGAEVRAHWRVSTDERRTADEWAVLVRGLLAQTGPGTPPSGVAVCSTVPAVVRHWREMLVDHFPGLVTVFVEPGARTGLAILTDNPREVGADRICNAVAALSRWGGPAVVVDFGTAITFDVLDARGQYVGGSISPGIEISLESLGRNAAQVRQVELRRPRSVIAANTVEAIQSGMVFGVASLVEGMVGRILVELGEEPGQAAVVATGHLARLILEECSCFTAHVPLLTLEGLAVVFARARSAKA